MARYIDAEKAVARLKTCLWGKDYDGVLAKSCIDDTPTADVRENVHAHWEPVHLTAFGVCSDCGAKWQFTELMSFCPNCGAEMDEVTE